jgi:hypothetical protein
MLDRLGQDCSPLQFLRELTKNSLEAIEATGEAGTVTWDVDWNYYELTGIKKLAIIDTGIGMTGPEMLEYINKLSSSVHVQSYDGNYGVGAKIAAATRNPAGLVYLSWKDGGGSMVHLWKDDATGYYGLKQFEWPDGTFHHWLPISDDVKPAEIGNHGTMVVLFGDSDETSTIQAPANVSTPSKWIAYFLNTRFFRFPKNVALKAREGWEYPRENTDTNLLRSLRGQAEYLTEHAQASGILQLTGAQAHWWILKDETALSQNSGVFASSGHVAALYQSELYELVTGRSATARLQSFGVIFGHNRVVLYVQPQASTPSTLTSNTSRTQLLLDGQPLPWVDWAAEFRQNMPGEITTLMDDVTQGKVAMDHRQAIRERLRQIRDLFRLSRYKPSSKGTSFVDENDVNAGPHSVGTGRQNTGKHRGGGRGGASGSGNLYALFASTDGQPADEVVGDTVPEVKWVGVTDGTRIAGDLEDRAARYLRDQHLLIINGDFRVFTDFESRWSEKYGGIPGAQEVIRETIREWFEQSLVEAVVGSLALAGSREWSTDEVQQQALSEEALTTAVMPRYHIEMAVKRALGARLGTLKDRVS